MCTHMHTYVMERPMETQEEQWEMLVQGGTLEPGLEGLPRLR